MDNFHPELYEANQHCKEPLRLLTASEAQRLPGHRSHLFPPPNTKRARATSVPPPCWDPGDRPAGPKIGSGPVVATGPKREPRMLLLSFWLHLSKPYFKVASKEATPHSAFANLGGEAPAWVWTGSAPRRENLGKVGPVQANVEPWLIPQLLNS